MRAALALTLCVALPAAAGEGQHEIPKLSLILSPEDQRVDFSGTPTFRFELHNTGPSRVLALPVEALPVELSWEVRRVDGRPPPAALGSYMGLCGTVGPITSDDFVELSPGRTHLRSWGKTAIEPTQLLAIGFEPGDYCLRMVYRTSGEASGAQWQASVRGRLCSNEVRVRVEGPPPRIAARARIRIVEGARAEDVLRRLGKPDWEFERWEEDSRPGPRGATWVYFLGEVPRERDEWAAYSAPHLRVHFDPSGEVRYSARTPRLGSSRRLAPLARLEPERSFGLVRVPASQDVLIRSPGALSRWSLGPRPARVWRVEVEGESLLGSLGLGKGGLLASTQYGETELWRLGREGSLQLERVWDEQVSALDPSPPAERARVAATPNLALSHDRNWLATRLEACPRHSNPSEGEERACLVLLERSSKGQRAKPVAHLLPRLSHDEPAALAFAPQGRYLLGGGLDAAILYRLDPAAPRPLRVVAELQFSDRVTQVLFSPDERWILLVGEWRTRLFRWDGAEGVTDFAELPGACKAAAFLAEGKRIVTCGREGTTLWEVPE